jgi:hypothetical protein
MESTMSCDSGDPAVRYGTAEYLRGNDTPDTRWDTRGAGSRSGRPTRILGVPNEGAAGVALLSEYSIEVRETGERGASGASAHPQLSWQP